MTFLARECKPLQQDEARLEQASNLVNEVATETVRMVQEGNDGQVIAKRMRLVILQFPSLKKYKEEIQKLVDAVVAVIVYLVRQHKIDLLVVG
jgi:hypothetical protein